MKAKEFRENEGFPKSSVTRNQKPYSTDDLMQDYSDHQNKELKDLVENIPRDNSEIEWKLWLTDRNKLLKGGEG